MPNNNVEWGQGSVNNSEGWGSGASNNTVGWGLIHGNTYGHDETNLTGGSQAVNDFIDRVIIDGGVVENPSYINSQYNKFIKYNPTLLNIPAAYSEGKAYSILPENGDGDLTWERASTKTRINGDGNIEEVPPNLLTYSNDFTNVGWSLFGTGDPATLDPNVALSPDGTLNASRLNFTSINNSRIQRTSNLSVISGQDYTFSFYLKGVLGNESIRFQYNDGSTTTTTPDISLSANWARYDIKININTSNLSFLGITNKASGGIQQVLIYNATLNIGTEVKESPITTDRLDVPALDYSSGTQQWSVEPQRVNIIEDSIDYTSSKWLKDAVTITPNAAISPDGTMTADRVNNKASGIFRLRQSRLVDSGDTYQYSFWVKKDTDPTIRISSQNFDSTRFVDFNFDTEEITNGTFKKGKNGWYRITGNFSTTNDLTGAIAFFGQTPNASTFIWNCQTEKGDYPTSDVITGASQVTRSLDQGTVDNLNTNNILTATEGAIYIEVDAESVARDAASNLFQVGGTNGRLYIYNDGTSKRFVSAYVEESNGFISGYRMLQAKNSILFNYNSTKVDIWVNGSKVYTSGAFNLNGELARLRGQGRAGLIGVQMMKNTMLTDTEAQQITS